MTQLIVSAKNPYSPSPPSLLVFKMAIVVVCLFLVLGRSMAYMGWPPLYGGEITIILFTLAFFRWRTLFSFIQRPIGLICVFYLLLAVPYIIIACSDAGISCMRFAVVVYYAIFIYFGYAALDSRLKQRFFMDAMYYAIILSICHTLLSRMVPLRQISPLINGVPLFGNIDQVTVYNILAVPYLLVFLPRLGVRKSLLMAVLVLLMHLFGGGRAGQLGIIGSLVVVLWYRRILLKSLAKYIVPCGIIPIFLCAFIFTFFPKSAIGTRIRHHGHIFVATWSDSPHLPGKAGAKRHRMLMWQEIFRETMRTDPWLGQGFRDRLVEVEFYHPHNSLVTIFGRMGFLGLSIALVIYLGIPIGIARRIRAVKDNEFQRYLLFYLCFVPCALIVGLTTPTLVSPYSALVCNFIFGGALRLHHAVSQENNDLYVSHEPRSCPAGGIT